jgi:hypothetical protein
MKNSYLFDVLSFSSEWKKKQNKWKGIKKPKTKKKNKKKNEEEQQTLGWEENMMLDEKRKITWIVERE